MDKLFPHPHIILHQDGAKFNPSMVTILCQSIKRVNCLYGHQLFRLPVSADTAVITLSAHSFLMPCCCRVPKEAPNITEISSMCVRILPHNESALSKFSPFDLSFRSRGDGDNETEHHH